MVQNPLIVDENRLAVPGNLLDDFHTKLYVLSQPKRKQGGYDSISDHLIKFYQKRLEAENPELLARCIEANGIGLSPSTYERARKGAKGSETATIKYELLDFICFVCFGEKLSQKIFEQKYCQGKERYTVRLPQYAIDEIKSLTDLTRSILPVIDGPQQTPPIKRKIKKWNRTVAIAILLVGFLVVGFFTINQYKGASKNSSKPDIDVSDFTSDYYAVFDGFLIKGNRNINEAGHNYDQKNTTYFFPNGTVRTGNQLSDSDFYYMPPETKIARDYELIGITTEDSAIDKFEVSQPEEIGRFCVYPDMTVVRWDSVQIEKVPVGSAILRRCSSPD